MEIDKTLILFSGLIFIIGGVGFALAKTDESARKKDEKRFGRLSSLNLGLGYILLRIKFIKVTMVILMILIGISLFISGLN